MVLTPGPNMVYLISRSVCQGPCAGLVSLGGMALGFVVYMLSAALGITGLMMAVPYAYDSLRIAGALYLLYLAWQAIKPGARSPFELTTLQQDSPRKLFVMGFMPNLLNPKVAVLYLSLRPQFIKPELGNVFGQSLLLGFTLIAISLVCNALITLMAGSIAGFISRKPSWLQTQRWLMATVLGALAVRMAMDSRR